MSVVFDAAADRIYSTTSVPSYNSAYTARFWFYSTGSAFEIAWAINDGSSNYDDFYIRDTGMCGIDTQAGYVDGISLTRPGWYHICVVRESTTVLKLYVDGTLVATNTANIAGRAASSRVEWGGFASFNYAPLSGAVAHPALFTVAFNATQVAADRNALQPQNYTNCWGYWPLAGLSLSDSSGSGNNLTSAGTLAEGADPSLLGILALSALALGGVSAFDVTTGGPTGVTGYAYGFGQVTKNTSTTTRTANATPAADPALVITDLDASSTYLFHTVVFFDTTANADFKLVMNFAGASSVRCVRKSVAAGATAFVVSSDLTAGSSSPSMSITGTGTNGGMVDVSCLVVFGSSPNASFAWSQDVSDAGNTSVLAGSFIEFIKVA